MRGSARLVYMLGSMAELDSNKYPANYCNKGHRCTRDIGGHYFVGSKPPSDTVDSRQTIRMGDGI